MFKKRKNKNKKKSKIIFLEENNNIDNNNNNSKLKINLNDIKNKIEENKIKIKKGICIKNGTKIKFEDFNNKNDINEEDENKKYYKIINFVSEKKIKNNFLEKKKSKENNFIDNKINFKENMSKQLYTLPDYLNMANNEDISDKKINDINRIEKIKILEIETKLNKKESMKNNIIDIDSDDDNNNKKEEIEIKKLFGKTFYNKNSRKFKYYEDEKKNKNENNNKNNYQKI